MKIINSKWIKCDLPWIIINCGLKCPEYPETDDFVRQKFGYLLQDYEDKLFGKTIWYSKEYQFCKNKFGRDFYDKIVDNKNYFKSKSKPLLKILKYIEIDNQITDFIESIPSIIEYSNLYSSVLIATELHIEKNSFVGKGLNKPGTLVEISTNGKLVQYLIGNITTSGSSNYDISDFNEDSIVKRYKIICQNG